MSNAQRFANVMREEPGLTRPARSLSDAFIQWQLETRRAMHETIAAGRHPRRHPAHLPVMITFTSTGLSTSNNDGPFPVRAATKGAGLTPRDGVLEQYIDLLEETLARCEGRPWEETLRDRVAAVQALLDHPEDIDPRRLGFLEIFQGGTYANLQRDPRVVLHYTGDGPDYPSFQINGYAEILERDDLRYRYIALARRIFEQAPFHLEQPGYAAGYLVWVQEVFDKTPYSLKKGKKEIREKGKKGKKAKSGEVEKGEVTFREILVPVDNSKYSEWAMDIALQIAGAFGSTVVGNHVYAARLHDQRFRDMEPGLPEEYQEPAILDHQRSLHDSLIDRGLKLISDSYLEMLEGRCREAGLTFAGKTPEGKNYAELVRDIEASRYDLVVMGVRGVGEVWRRGEQRDQVLGSVCERVARRITRDVLLVKDDRPLEGTFVVGVDGSDRSFAALRIALALAEATGAQVHAVAVYDPFLHKTLFNELEEALTEEARQVFNTEAQQKLHDELIDSGIAKLYQDHLQTAQRIAAEVARSGDRPRPRSGGMGALQLTQGDISHGGGKSEIRNPKSEIETHLLAGKPYAAVLRYLKEVQPSLLAVGRTGVHADDGLDIGSNAENLLRLAPCNVLLVGRTFAPTWAETREVVEERLAWTSGALARLERVPDFARGMARKAIEDYARQQGLEVVDEQVVVAARQRFGM